MLPAPEPSEEYLAQASDTPTTKTPGYKDILVVLDLNGTILSRPNKNPTSFIPRPFIEKFLHYLFENFQVMIWSSALPRNTVALVDNALTAEHRSMLVAVWGRDMFGLSIFNYSQNVQVYKNLQTVWRNDQVQQKHPAYATGARFEQHNTILIDDSYIKASAQPFTLLESPTFEAKPDLMEVDALGEVVGYIEFLRHQDDVSKFIKRQPFKSKDPCDWLPRLPAPTIKVETSPKDSDTSSTSTLTAALAGLALTSKQQEPSSGI